MNTPRFTDRQLAKAIAQAAGNITLAANSIGMTPAALRKRMQRSPMLREAVYEARQQLCDHAESSLLRAVLAGEAWAVCFALKCQGKDRGYVERQEVEDISKAKTIVIEDSKWYHADSSEADNTSEGTAASGSGPTLPG